MHINKDHTVDNTGMTASELRDEILDNANDYSSIWDGDIADLF